MSIRPNPSIPSAVDVCPSVHSPKGRVDGGQTGVGAEAIARMAALLRGEFVMPELRTPGRYVQPLELRRLALGIRQEDEPE